MWNKGSLYLKKMGGVIMLASVIIWALGYFPRNTKSAEEFDKKITQTEIKYNGLIADCKPGSEEFISLSTKKKELLNKLRYEKSGFLQENSYIGKIGKFVEPVMKPLGFDWRMSVSLLAGVAAKEIVVSTMGVLYQAEADPANVSESLVNKLQNTKYRDGPNIGKPVFNPISAFAYLMFVLFIFRAWLLLQPSVRNRANGNGHCLW